MGPYTLHVHLGAPAAPVTLVITHTALPSMSDEEAEPGYLANYALTSSRATKTRLTVLGIVLVLGSVVTVLSLGRLPAGKPLYQMLSPGNVSEVHRLFENDCVQCHQGAWQRVADSACKACHNQPRHDAAQRFTPRCATCHQEHRSRQEALTIMADSLCVQCHANLHTAHAGPLTVADRLHSFVDDHPEFAVTVQTAPAAPPTRVRLDAAPQDLTPIKLNHALHLKPGKLGVQGVEQLTCDHCHQMDAQGASMRPITYDRHCAACHSLAFDPRFPEQTVPHATPKAIHTFLVNTFTQYVLNHLEACETRVQKPIRRRPGQPPTRQEARATRHPHPLVTQQYLYPSGPRTRRSYL